MSEKEERFKDWDTFTIIDWILDSNINFFHLEDSEFIKKTEEQWNDLDDKDFYFTENLDTIQSELVEAKDISAGTG